MGIKIVIPPSAPQPPTREQFPDEEEFLEALAYWRHAVGRVLAMAQSTRRRIEGSPPIQADQNQPSNEGPPLPVRNRPRQGSLKRRRRAKKPKLPLDEVNRQRLYEIAQRALADSAN